jgi:tetratricopeptide (TPR) repeat protein
MLRYSIVLLSSLFLLTACKEAGTPQESRLGDAHLATSGDEAALPHFEQGLLLLHSFEYEDARAAFVKAQEADPDFAMAYWGEAMTHNHPIWHRQEYEEGQAALLKLGDSPEARLAKAETELEKDLLKAAETLFGEGEKVARDKAYADYLAKLHEKYPENQEVAAFYALSLLGAVPVGRDVEAYEKGAAIAQGILKENPRHPGALHYLIHSYDDPSHARLALNAADSYAKVAPDAAHALHMPSHIYVAMGMWDEVISSNIASYDASVKRMEEKGLTNDARSYHAFHWLLYGYTQKGNTDKVIDILEKMVQYTNEQPSKTARAYLVRMKGNFLVETQRWGHELADVEIDLKDLNISHQAVAHFLEGMQAYRAGEETLLAGIIDTLASKRQQASMSMTNEGIPMCSAGGSFGKPNRVDVGQAEVMELELKALLARLRGEEQQAEALMQQAVTMQDELNYSYGPPEIIYPAYEFYADYLMEQERYEEALAQYERALERGPGRLRALAGKERAENENSHSL